jgi:aryl-alcohol dehydrogenase-like predicted oxidoreductase
VILKPLGQSDLDVSQIGLGALHFGTYLSENQSAEIIGYALDSGINLIDVGPLYGNGLAERIVGKVIAGRRDQVILTTKVGLVRRELVDGSFGVDVLPLTPRNIRKSLERSLVELGTDYIDLFQFHAYDANTALEDSFGVMNELVAEGKVRAIGVSNFSPEELLASINVIEKNSWIPIASIESHYNMIERMVEGSLTEICLENNIGLLPYRSLARGILTSKYKIGEPLPVNSRAVDSWRVRDWLTDETLSLVDSLSKYAKENNNTITGLSLSWLLAQKFVPSVLVGARSIMQLQESISAVNCKLTPSDLIDIDKIIKSRNQLEKVRSLPNVYFEK